MDLVLQFLSFNKSDLKGKSLAEILEVKKTNRVENTSPVQYSGDE